MSGSFRHSVACFLAAQQSPSVAFHMMRTETRRRMTSEEFLRSGIERPCELVRGELRVMTPASGGHGVVATRVLVALFTFVEERGLGMCFADNTGFLLPGLVDTVRSPDAAFLSRDRLPAEGFGGGWVHAAPNLVVEIVSPNESRADLEAKVSDYFAAGTELVWVVDSVARQVTARTVSGERKYSASETLDGGPVLPEFSIAVASLFTGLGATTG